MIKTFGRPWLRRTAFALFSLVIVAFGVLPLVQGNSTYRNWWGVLVFAPSGIVVGLLGLGVAAFKPEIFQGTTKAKSRMRGWPK